MTEGQVGIVIFFSIAIGASLLCHSLIRRYLIATLVASALAVCVFQAAVYLKNGYLDPFFFVVIGTTGAAGLATSAIVGAPFLYVRRMRASRRAELSKN